MKPEQLIEFVVNKMFRNKEHVRAAWRGTRGDPAVKNAEHNLGHTGGMQLILDQVHTYVPRVTRGLDIWHCTRLTTYHDLVAEWEGGDTNDHHLAETPEEKQKAKERKHQRELASAWKAVEELPPNVQKDIVGLWLEYDAGKTRAAKLIKQIDKLEFVFTGLYYPQNGRMTPEHLMEEFLPKAYSEKRIKHPYLLALLDELNRIAQEQFG